MTSTSRFVVRIQWAHKEGLEETLVLSTEHMWILLILLKHLPDRASWERNDGSVVKICLEQINVSERKMYPSNPFFRWTKMVLLVLLMSHVLTGIASDAYINFNETWSITAWKSPKLCYVRYSMKNFQSEAFFWTLIWTLMEKPKMKWLKSSLGTLRPWRRLRRPDTGVRKFTESWHLFCGTRTFSIPLSLSPL